MRKFIIQAIGILIVFGSLFVFAWVRISHLYLTKFGFFLEFWWLHGMTLLGITLGVIVWILGEEL